MCSAELNVSEGKTAVKCDFCGTTQTVPTVNDENLRGLFNRANILRMKSEFDKAEQIYEKIIQADSAQSEAYWGLILCKFGIEYVEDPTTYKRIPTCHRTSLDSIIADDDYKSALNYADSVQREIYETEAKEIDRLQKEIIALSQKESPYDVFICYKETDENGKRTQDSVIANDIYYQLKQEGFKVFYAAITLEDKLGSAYEPCIFAALNSAKVMLSIGTKPEYFNAVWVKNEWSRFLKIMKKDRSRLLIPCYKDMDAYELPEEFAHLQAQDMSKIGFINDVVRGIKKIISPSKQTSSKREAASAISSSTNTAPLLQRVFIFLEDGNWESADSYCEKVLDLEPQNALAYLGKLMSELKLRTQSDLANCSTLLDNNGNYQKAVKFADEELKSFLIEASNSVKNRVLEKKYELALEVKEKLDCDSDYDKVISLFEELGDYKNSAALAEECRNMRDDLRNGKKYAAAVDILENAINEEEMLKGIEIFESLGDYKDSREQKEKYRDAWNHRKERAASVLKEYCDINQKINDKTLEIQNNSQPIKELNKAVETAKLQIKNIQNETNKIHSIEASIEIAYEQLDKTKKEMLSLGIFAFAKRKELSARIKEIETSIANSLSNINRSEALIKDCGALDKLQASIDRNLKKIEEEDKALKYLKEESNRLRTLRESFIRKLANRQIIVTLSDETEALALLLTETKVIARIRADDELRYIIRNSTAFEKLPFNIKKRISGCEALDDETSYYQACQAMDSAKRVEDIEWARDQFAAIRNYKDSAQRLEKCNILIKNKKNIKN